MHKDLIVKTRSLAGTSDLTLLAPIKSGLVESIESVSHKTRVKRLLEALHLGRSNSQEYALLRPFSDAVERVGRIHSVRVTVFEPEDKVLLAVSFDGSWESYVRVLWQKVGALLDVIFCDTEGYPLACASSYETWAAWVRHVQRETQFYYGMPGLTVDDVHSLRKEESLHLRFPGQASTDLQATRQVVRSAEEQAWDTARHISPSAVVETVRQGLQSLSYIHRLTALYPPATPDGRVLQRAARQLLRELVGLAENTHVIDGFLQLGRRRFDEQIDWLLSKDPLEQRPVPDLIANAQNAPADQVQAGITTAYGAVSHGAVVLIGLADATAATTLLTHLRRAVTPSDAPPAPDGLVINAAFTHEGLRVCGVSELELACLPMEFRQGMEARAATLGDFRHNHPRRWARPERCGPNGRPDPAAPRVQLAEVHALVQMRAMLTDDPDVLDDDWLYAGTHALSNALSDLLGLGAGVCVLSVQPMRRFTEAGQTYEHFGFADGGAQPSLDPRDTSDVYDNRVPLGEVLLGYHNQADFAPAQPPDGNLPPDEQAAGDARALAAARESVRELLLNGSFLVVRKLRQDVAALESAVADAVKQTGIPRADLLAKMMGRRPDGAALAAPRRGNDFDYDGDTLGRLCPFHAHVRRANPRPRDTAALPLPAGGRFPRIVRRGMSYGPRYDRSGHDTARNERPRGMVFMAYNASIGEQFETVQRWLSGGNSTGGYSDQSDPFLGVAPVGQRRQFRFEHEGRAVSMALDGADRPLDDPHPFVQVEWGAYLLAPSIGALDMLLKRAHRSAAAARPTCPWSGRRGEKLLQTLPAGDPMPSTAPEVGEWKRALEDAEAIEKYRAADVWAAVREQHGGILRTPYGVLVAERNLALQVLCHPENYSVQGYLPRMRASIGEIFLGQDPDASGRDPRAQVTNAAIHQVTREEAYALTLARVAAVVKAMAGAERDLAQQARRREWELNLNLRELIDQSLAALCQAWFGLEANPTHAGDPLPGALRWDLKPGMPPRYPGHFTPPSRYIFQPHPGEFTQGMGEVAGRSLKESMLGLVRRHRAASTLPQAPDGRAAPLSAAMFHAFERSSDEELASGLAGVMMGMLPTLDGNLVRVLDEWLRDGSFWRLRRELVRFGDEPSLADAQAVLMRPLVEAMQQRPTPELIWRTAVRDGVLGGEPVHAGEVVVVSLVSVTQALAESGQSDEKAGHLHMVFGGAYPGSSTHACPGYEAAMGAMLGTIAALLATAEPMRPSPARLAVDFVGEAKAPAVLPAAPLASRLAHVQTAELALTARGEGRGWLLAEGDSWFDDLNQFGVSRKNNLLRILDEDFDYRVEQVAQSGDGLADMASPTQLAAFSARLRRMAALGRHPRAILLSSGGNDVVGAQLAALLQPGAKVPRDALNIDRVRAKVGGPCAALGGFEPAEGQMSAALRTIVRHYVAQSAQVWGRAVPILLHGYDHPVPDGRNLFGVPRSPLSWLYPAFSALGYGDAADSVDTAGLSLRTGVMALLIDVLNEMQQWVARDPYLAGQVQWVDLRGTLSTTPGAYPLDWANELHPTEAGFSALAARLARAIR
ncbi:hypothetical protein AACH06_00285 [Ideonella sp. DXS29W]|uniref:Dyp-type peroxidase C-terminal domain-containing protein n=1 Tax=Ideonella lacteola TaxID=2984193 RepID=A0ABU9BHE2_9BURK